MKKTVYLVGLLVAGFASAQTDKDYLGKVGINILTPQATMDIRPNDDNRQEIATTNEGILIPKLSKTRVANIKDGLLVEGTLAYVTDDDSSPIAAYAGTNAKVAKITEKGYYYYDGTEWEPAKLNQMGATDGQVLKYNEATNSWVPSNITTPEFFYGCSTDTSTINTWFLSDGILTCQPDWITYSGKVKVMAIFDDPKSIPSTIPVETILNPDNVELERLADYSLKDQLWSCKPSLYTCNYSVTYRQSTPGVIHLYPSNQKFGSSRDWVLARIPEIYNTKYDGKWALLQLNGSWSYKFR